MTEPVSRKRQSLINLGFHYANIGLVIVQGIILTPLYLRYVSPSLYGAWLATGNLLAWIQLIDPGLSRIMQQRVAHTYGQRNLEQLSRVIGTGLLLGCCLSALPLAALPFSGAMAGSLSLSPAESGELAHAIVLALVSACVSMASFQPAAANLGLQLSTGAGIIYISSGVCGIVGTVVMLYSGYALSALAWGFVIRAVVLGLGNTLLLWIWSARHFHLRFHVTREEIRRYAGLSTFTFVERLGNTLLQQSDMYLCARMLFPGAAAVYALTGRAYDPIRLASERVGPAFLPGIAHLAGEGGAARVADVSNRLLNLIAYIISVGVASVIALNSAFVSLWVGPDYFGGQRLTAILAASVVMNVVLSCWSELVFAVGGIGQVEIMKAVEGVIRVIVQVVMVRLYGVIGLPLGACIGMLLVSGWYLPRLAARLFKVPTSSQYRRWAGYLLRSAIMICLGLLGHEFASRTFLYWTWPRFIMMAGCMGSIFAAFGLLLHTAVRQEFRVVADRVSAPLRRCISRS